MTTVQQFDLSVDLLRTVLWQYDRAEALQAILRRKNEWMESKVAGFWEWWRREVFDLDTATDFGLSVWSIILEVPLGFDVPASGPRPVFGFGPFNQNFTNGNFGRDVAGSMALSTSQKRLVLKLRYFQLISRGTVPEMNHFLRVLFGDAHAVDNLDMSFSVVFRYVPTPDVMFILNEFDLLPRPAGVKLNLLIDPLNVFGFAPYYQNFENGGFARRDT